MSLPSDAVPVEIDRFGQGFQRRGRVQGTVRPVLIMVDLVRAQDPPQMALVPDSRWAWFQTRVRSRSSRRHPPIQRSAIAFMRGVRTLHSTVRIPASARTAVPAQDRVRGNQQLQPVAAGFRYHGEQGRQECPVRPVQPRAARLPPLQDSELMAQDQDLCGLGGSGRRNVRWCPATAKAGIRQAGSRIWSIFESLSSLSGTSGNIPGMPWIVFDWRASCRNDAAPLPPPRTQRPPHSCIAFDELYGRLSAYGGLLLDGVD